MPNFVTITLMKMNKPKRLKLRKWAELEGIRKAIREYAKDGIYLPCVDLIYDTLRLCGVRGNFSKKPWFKTVEVYADCYQKNLPRLKFPILSGEGSDETVPWEYQGRDWYWWLNILAGKYGWEAGRVAEMDIDDAIGLYQEMEAQDQLEKEWEHGLSELAYEYSPATKKSKYKPLDRPKWMRMTKEMLKKKPVIKTKILASMMPIGNIVNLDEE